MSAVGRLFIALDLPDGVRDALAAWARQEVGDRSDLRRIPSDALHLTLVFLGDRPIGHVDAILEAVTAVADGPIPLGLGPPLWLAPRHPHVLTVEITDPAGALAALHGRLEARLGSAIGWEPERRVFRPHVTVARVRRGARVRPVGLQAPAPMRFGGEAVSLYRSHLDGAPPRYEAVGRVVLPGPG